MYQPFDLAKPVWETGKEKEMNYFLAFVSQIPQGNASIRLTASTAYTCYVNGRFAFQGPARGPEGFFRVDQRDLTPFLTQQQNIIDLEVAGYNCRSFEYQRQDSFLQAEIMTDGNIIAATGTRGFVAVPITEKLRKTLRYSYQRVFTEAYRLDEHSLAYRTDMPAPDAGVKLAIQPEKKLLKRGILDLEYPRLDARRKVSEGTFSFRKRAPEDYWTDRAHTGVGPRFDGFQENELECHVTHEIEDRPCNLTACNKPYEREQFKPNETAIYAFDFNAAGMLGCTVQCRSASTVYLVFEELLTDGDIDYSRMKTANVLKYDLQPGTYQLLTCEPYVMKYVKVMVERGECLIGDLHLLQVICPGVNDTLATGSEDMKAIYQAACNTFRQNAVDIFMDCPSRERAGWLCDSFWTARVERHLTGNSRIERNFLENFLLPQQAEGLPKGMFPMCYPSDHPAGTFIPNWAMWLVLELEEYWHRAQDRKMVDGFHDKIMDLVDYFDRFTNEDGLLEKLESWVFLEWSPSNSFVQDVNYPSNMLFAATLDAIGRMYQNETMTKRAQTMRETIRRQSFNGQFFTDNAVRQDGSLVNPGHTTESCQYYAFFTETATPQTFPQLWETLRTDFGPHRKKTMAFPDVPCANAFVGNYLRLECLWKEGLKEQVRREIEGYFLKMAKLTGTLWENDTSCASCNHGFASHVAIWIDGSQEP